MCGEFKCESNGSFGNKNGVRTRKLGPKRRKQKMVDVLGDFARDYAILAMSRGNVASCQSLPRKFHKCVRGVVFLGDYDRDIDKMSMSHGILAKNPR